MLPLSKTSRRKNQTLLKAFLGLFCSCSRNNQDCLLWYSPDISFSSMMSYLVQKNESHPWPSLKNVSGVEMKSSGSPLPSTSVILFPLVEWTLPRSLFGGQSGLGLHYGVQPFYSPMWFCTKIYFTTSPLLTVTTSDLRGKTKSNRLSALWICTWRLQCTICLCFLSRSYPGSVWPGVWCCLSKHVD